MKEHEMKYLQQEFHDTSISLKSFGIDEYGWSKCDIKAVYNCLQKEQIVVIGGDVYYQSEAGEFEDAYANWHCEPEQETKSEYVKRSITYANDYLNKIIECEGRKVIVVPVIGLIY